MIVLEMKCPQLSKPEATAYFSILVFSILVLSKDALFNHVNVLFHAMLIVLFC